MADLLAPAAGLAQRGGRVVSDMATAQIALLSFGLGYVLGLLAGILNEQRKSPPRGRR